MLLSIMIPQAVSPALATDRGPLRFVTSGAKNVQERTSQALRERWYAIVVPAKRFDQAPDIRAPYAPGKLSGEFIRQNLECVNLFRYSAGLPFVSASDADNCSAQYGAVLLAAANTLDHHPGRPSGMGDSFYQKGCDTLAAANIGYLQYAGDQTETKKRTNAVPTLMRNYMNDCGAFNRSCVPHRRWILYPGLQTVGIGCADSSDGTMYQVLKIMGCAAARVDYDFIAWPASGAFPAQLLSPDVPWSVSLNPGVFEIPDRSELTITVTRLEDGRVWKLDGTSARSSENAQFLLVDDHRYGVNNCIIFAFDSKAGGLYRGDYHVNIAGLTTCDGDSAMLDYRIWFADIDECVHRWSDWITDAAAACTEDGSRHRICTSCGQAETSVVSSLGHDWNTTEVLRASAVYSYGRAAFVCARCGAEKIDRLPLAACKNVICPSSRFTDMPARGSWAHNGVDFVLDMGIFTGTGPSTFSPKGYMTRATMVTVLWRIAGMPDAQEDCGFRDVKEHAFYARAVRWASENGLVKGLSAECLGPAHQNPGGDAASALFCLGCLRICRKSGRIRRQ